MYFVATTPTCGGGELKPELAADAPQFRADPLRMRTDRPRHIAVGTNRHPALAENPGLLKRDFFARLAEVIGVVDVHAGHHRAIAVEHVHRIQPAAQPYFEDRDIHLVLDEQ